MRRRNTRAILFIAPLLLAPASDALAAQPRVQPAPNEPSWVELLQKRWGLDMDRDLRNPLTQGVTPAGLFVRVDAKKPVIFAPVIALGLETKTHGGWYSAGPKASDIPGDPVKARAELWSYAFKQPKAQMDSGEFTPPPLQSGEAAFDPGGGPFGLWISNDEFNDGGVYTQPGLVMKVNARLKAQPYKVMIYPNRDGKGKFVPDSYIIGWEYSTNDDFQDVVTRIDNVRLLPPDPALRGVLGDDTQVRKLAGDYKFVEGPAWDSHAGVLYFTNIPDAQILAYAEGKPNVLNASSGEANGLMVDKAGLLVRCEGAGRRVSRGKSNQPGETVVSHYQGKRLNSPNDLWIDEEGGIYFTDPRYDKRDDLEQDKEAVYYVTTAGAITRVADDAVRPNGIAISPDGKYLYIVDHGADALLRYEIASAGKLGKHERLASVEEPDGMSVDADGRLYVTSRRGVWVLAPSGKWLGMIATLEQPANCTFGGRDGGTLFITAQTSLYAIQTKTRGWHIHLQGRAK